MQKIATLESLIEPVVEGLGYLYVGIQQFPQGKHSLIRLYIDKPKALTKAMLEAEVEAEAKPEIEAKPGRAGVTVEDCELVSRQVGAVLEVELPQIAQYTLEVSSPGLDRILFRPEQFREYLGKQISVHLNVAINGQRNFKGILKDVQSSVICIESVAQGLLTLSLTDIHEARLVPEW